MTTESNAGPLKVTGTLQIGELCTLNFGGKNRIGHCRIAAIKIYENDVKYDIVVPVGGREFIHETILYEVESAFIIETP